MFTSNKPSLSAVAVKALLLYSILTFAYGIVWPEMEFIESVIGWMFIFSIPIVNIFIPWSVKLFISVEEINSLSVKLWDVTVVLSLLNIPVISAGVSSLYQ